MHRIGAKRPYHLLSQVENVNLFLPIRNALSAECKFLAGLVRTCYWE